jgi:superoxide dismutase
MKPNGGGNPTGKLAEAINNNFGSFLMNLKNSSTTLSNETV